MDSNGQAEKHPFRILLEKLEASGLGKARQEITSNHDDPRWKLMHQLLPTADDIRVFPSDEARVRRIIKDGKEELPPYFLDKLAHMYLLVPDGYRGELLDEHRKLVDKGNAIAIQIEEMKELARNYSESLGHKTRPFPMMVEENPPPKPVEKPAVKPVEKPAGFVAQHAPKAKVVRAAKPKPAKPATGEMSQEQWYQPLSEALQAITKHHNVSLERFIRDYPEKGPLIRKAYHGKLGILKQQTRMELNFIKALTNLSDSPVEMRFMRAAFNVEARLQNARTPAEKDLAEQQAKAVIDLGKRISEWSPREEPSEAGNGKTLLERIATGKQPDSLEVRKDQLKVHLELLALCAGGEKELSLDEPLRAAYDSVVSGQAWRLYAGLAEQARSIKPEAATMTMSELEETVSKAVKGSCELLQAREMQEIQPAILRIEQNAVTEMERIMRRITNAEVEALKHALPPIFAGIRSPFGSKISGNGSPGAVGKF